MSALELTIRLPVLSSEGADVGSRNVLAPGLSESSTWPFISLRLMLPCVDDALSWEHVSDAHSRIDAGPTMLCLPARADSSPITFEISMTEAAAASFTWLREPTYHV